VHGSVGSTPRSHGISLWETSSGKATGQLQGDAALVGELRFSANARSLAVVVESFHVSKDDVICLQTLDVRLWDVSKRKLTRTLTKSGNPRFASDGKSAAVLILDGKTSGAQLVDPDTGKEKAKFEGHKDATRAVDLAPDGKLLATGGQDGLVKV